MPDAESAAILEARRVMEVCNACRYCEGYCPVFPAMELRREFAAGDLSYLANLCHSCRGCYYACQYAPPHEFAINVPQALGELRTESYERYAWPRPLARLYARNGLFMALAMAAGISVVLLLTLLLQSPDVVFGIHHSVSGGGFYRVIPYRVMAGVGSIFMLFSLLAILIGCARCWSDGGLPAFALLDIGPWLQALRDAATLRHLGGGGHGCNDRGESFSFARRRLHHALAYGFLLCFAATSCGAFYHYFLGWRAPYPWLSPPVILGLLGGIGLTVGAGGLLWLKATEDRQPRAQAESGAGAGLLLLLLLIAVTGLLLLALRATSAMGVVLAIHLGLVLALFATMPYSKLVHAPYRLLALLPCDRARCRAARGNGGDESGSSTGRVGRGCMTRTRRRGR